MQKPKFGRQRSASPAISSLSRRLSEAKPPKTAASLPSPPRPKPKVNKPFSVEAKKK